MEKYQREVVALIRATAARFQLLHDHRLIDLWKQYSWEGCGCRWLQGSRVEASRFLAWANRRTAVVRELMDEERRQALPLSPRIRTRRHSVRRWDNRYLVERSLVA